MNFIKWLFTRWYYYLLIFIYFLLALWSELSTVGSIDLFEFGIMGFFGYLFGLMIVPAIILGIIYMIKIRKKREYVKMNFFRWLFTRWYLYALIVFHFVVISTWVDNYMGFEVPFYVTMFNDPYVLIGNLLGAIFLYGLIISIVVGIKKLFSSLSSGSSSSGSPSRDSSNSTGRNS